MRATAGLGGGLCVHVCMYVHFRHLKGKDEPVLMVDVRPQNYSLDVTKPISQPPS